MARRQDGDLRHARFADLPYLLEPGDVLVVNTSATLPASLDATADGRPATLHLSGRLPGGLWMVELRHRNPDRRRPDPVPGGPASRRPASTPWLDAGPGTVVPLPAGGRAELRLPASAAAHRAARSGSGWRLLTCPSPCSPTWPATAAPSATPTCRRPGRSPATRPCSPKSPGSAEMPSAARPFSAEVITRLVVAGRRHRPLRPALRRSRRPSSTNRRRAEWYRVPPTTAAQINAARGAGGRVIAVGTTAVRALETVADPRGVIHPGEGWTELVVDADHPVRSVDGLLTGWHEPGASHLAHAARPSPGPSLVGRPTRRRGRGYLWHEFGDSHLVLP